MLPNTETFNMSSGIDEKETNSIKKNTLLIKEFSEEEVKKAFSYLSKNDNEAGNIGIVKTGTTIKCKDYKTFYEKFFGEFTYVQGKEEKCPYAIKTRSNLNKKPTSKGWKLHISIDDTKDDGNLEKGWDIVMDNIIKHQVYWLKIVRNEHRKTMAKNEDYHGKTVTIYSFKENRPTQKWEEFITDVTNDFIRNKINPGPVSIKDTEINGSNYFSYRNDGVMDEETNPNIFSSIKIAIPKQPKRVVYKNEELTVQTTNNQLSEENTSSSCSPCKKQ
ncbi:MAG: hypothetical protein LEGION0398_MBIBDBAK_00222 [Legionellaceae bacterium]